MVLSDRTIKERLQKGDLVIDPVDYKSIEPASVDLHLGAKFLVFNNHKYEVLDVKKNVKNYEMIDVKDDGYFIVHPNEFVLGTTSELVKVPRDLLGRLDGRSSLGRLGLIIHATAGFIDPGFEGNITLEMLNISRLPIKIYPGMRIAQLSFEFMSTPVDVAYGEGSKNSKYNGQTEPKPSQIWRDFIGK